MPPVKEILPDNCGGDVFGLHLTQLEPAEVAELLLYKRRAPGTGAGLVVTVNIQHIATMRTDREFRTAVAEADLVTCDGFPVYLYARHHGYNIERRTTGREIVADIMEKPLPQDQRPYFVVDSDETANALRAWGVKKGISDRLGVEVPPWGFVKNSSYCEELSMRISDFKATLLFMCTGAPQSEIYTHRYRMQLPPCWAVCVGQSARLVLGLNPQPPKLAEKLNLEWLWRILLEPRRMLKRYVPSGMGFLMAMLEDSRSRKNAGC